MANFIAGAIKHPGALHKELKVPAGQRIPEKKLDKAEKSSNPTERKRAALAKTLESFHKGTPARGPEPDRMASKPPKAQREKVKGPSGPVEMD